MNLERQSGSLLYDLPRNNTVIKVVGLNALEELLAVADTYPTEVKEQVEKTKNEFDALKQYYKNYQEDLKNGKIKLKKGSYQPLKSSLDASIKRAIKDGVLNKDNVQNMNDNEVYYQMEIKEVVFFREVFKDIDEILKKIEDNIAHTIIYKYKKSQYEYQVEHDPHLQKVEEIKAFQKENGMDWVVSWDIFNNNEISEEKMEIIYPYFKKVKAISEELDNVILDLNKKLGYEEE
mgnify:CR=1 FL=1